MLDGNTVYQPAHSFGLDSSRVLKEVMGSPERNEEAEKTIRKIFRLIDLAQYSDAKAKIKEAAQSLGDDDAEIIRARALLDFLETPI